MGVTLPTRMSPGPDDAVIVVVCEHLLRLVGNLAGNLLRTELGVAGIDLVTGDVDRGEQVLLDHTVGDDDAVLVVVALPRHVGHGEVHAERELGVIDRGAVSQGLASLYVIAHVHDGTVVDAGALVGALVLGQVVLLGAALVRVDNHVSGVDLVDNTSVGRADDLAGVEGGAGLHACAHVRGVRTNQRHGLALHVGAHEGTLGVIVLEERDEVRGDGEHLAGRDVHEVDVRDLDLCGGTYGQ